MLQLIIKMSNNDTRDTHKLINSSMDKSKDDKYMNKNISNKPHLTFKELLFELNNLKKYKHSPKVDLYERNNLYIIKMELPGLTENDITIQLRDNQILLVSGIKHNLTIEENDNIIYSECHYGNFMRRVKVPLPVFKDSIKTVMSNGVLILTVEKVKANLLETIPENKVVDFNNNWT